MRRDEQQADHWPTSDEVLHRTGSDRWWAACRVVATSMSAGTEGARAARTLAEIVQHPVDDELGGLVDSAIADLRNPQTVDAVWERALARPDERLQALLTESGHEPADPALRALWLLLTGQYERYAELDVDGSLLSVASRDADPGLRGRIAEQTRAARRAERTEAPQDSSAEPACPSNQMLLQGIHTVLELAERLRPVAAAPAERRLEMINSLQWPYLGSADDLFRAVIDMVALLQPGEQGVRLLAIALAGATLDLEPFVPPQEISARLAVQEVRFWTGVLLSTTQPVQYENADSHIRQGIRRVSGLDRQAGTVDATALKPALDALKLALFAVGHFNTLVTLEMGFDGLSQYEQIQIDVPDSPILQVAMRSRTALHGVASGFGHRLDLVPERLRRKRAHASRPARPGGPSRRAVTVP